MRSGAILLWLAPLVLLIAAVGGKLAEPSRAHSVDGFDTDRANHHVNNLGRRLETPGTGDELQRLSETLNECWQGLNPRCSASPKFNGRRFARAADTSRTSAPRPRWPWRERTDQEYRSALQHVLAESERMTRMLEQLLALVRADSGSETIEMADVDIAE